MPLPLSSLDAMVFDFDGVLTDDRGCLDEEGHKMVCCARKDGLGFGILRRTGLKNPFILSSEKIPVVSRLWEKLQLPVLRGVTDKFSALTEFGGRDVIFCNAPEHSAVDAHSRRWLYGPLVTSLLQEPARPILPPPGHKGSQTALPR